MAALHRPLSRIVVALAALLVAFLTLAASAASATTSQRQADRRVVIVVATDPVQRTLQPRIADHHDPRDSVLRHYARLGLHAGLLSTTQGEYTQGQSLLDITQGARQPQAIYDTPLLGTELRGISTGGVIRGWADVRRRARDASETLRPGLLAETVGGATFVAADGVSTAPALLAADESGRIDDVSSGSDSTLIERYRAAVADGAELVVVAQPAGGPGQAFLGEVVESIDDGTLLVAVHLPPTPPEDPPVPNPSSRFFLQTAIGIEQPTTSDGGSLRSPSTRRAGLVAAIDIAPTVLEHLGIDVPRSMRGHAIETTVGDELAVSDLERLRRRWSLVRAGRQGQALQTTVLLGLAVVVVGGLFGNVGAMARLGARVLGLALMAAPAAAIATARFVAPATSNSEALTIAGTSIAVGFLADRFVRWPVAAIVPAALSLAVVAVDLAVGGDGLAASVIGPSVASGNRFYGVSNELAPVLPSLLLAAVAAAATAVRPADAERHRRSRVIGVYAAGAVLLAAVVAAGRLGADVGGVVTIAGAFAVAAIVASESKPSRKVVAVVVAVSAVAGLVLLIAVDRIAGADSHLANNLDRLESPAEFFELFARRWELAVHVAAKPAQLVSLAVAVVVTVFVYRHREVTVGPLPSPFWRAALVGTVAGGVCGALSNDSGPILFVNAVVAAAAIVLYLRGGPGLPPTRVLS